MKTTITTDDWPYLYLERRTIPRLYLVVTVILVLASLAGVQVPEDLAEIEHIARRVHLDSFLEGGFGLLPAPVHVEGESDDVEPDRGTVQGEGPSGLLQRFVQAAQHGVRHLHPRVRRGLIDPIASKRRSACTRREKRGSAATPMRRAPQKDSQLANLT